MGEANTQAINIDELMAKIRAEVARRRAESAAVDSPPRSTEGTVATIDWSRLRGSLGTAEQYAQIGTFLPGWPRFGRVRRRVARLTARMVLYVSDFLTNRQRAFNNAVLQVLNFLGESLPQVENHLVEQRGELEKLVHQVHDSVTAVEQLKRDESALLARFADVDSRVTTIEHLHREESQQRENELRNLHMRLDEIEQRQQSEVVRRDERIAVVEHTLQEVQNQLGETDRRQQSEAAQRDERINAAEHALQGVQDQLGKLEQDEIPRLVADLHMRLDEIEQRQQSEVVRRDERIAVVEHTLQEVQNQLGETDRRQQSEAAQRDERINAAEHALQGVQDQLGKLEQDEIPRLVADLHMRLDEIEQRQQSEVVRRDERIAVVEHTLQEVQNQLGETDRRQQSEAAQRDERINAAEHALQGVQDQLGKLEQDEIPRLVAELARRHEQLQSLERTLALLKTDVILQERRVTVLLEEARKRLPEPFDQEQLNVLAEEEQHRLDALYVSFEDQFRGTREEIKGRLTVYLPILKQASIGTEAMPILDVGCGRGEWLEVLQEEGLVARGLDINRVLVEHCRQRGFEVAEGDVLAYLRSLPEASVGAVTGFHLIEHLPFDSFIKLLDETVRVLKPGGVAIFETPNPQNVFVGSCNFYLDPTHRNPLPSPTVKFLAEARGLCRVEVLNLHPFPSALRVNGSAVAERFNEYFYGPQDYAVIGWKV